LASASPHPTRMSAKRFRGKLCVYCCDRPATTADHIFAREFFVLGTRGNLPQVPACQECNNDKSKLEHYLTAVLPFGGCHADAHENLVNLVPGRLAKNLRLHRELSAGSGRIWRMESGLFRETMTLPIEPKKICALFSHAARALVWHHWGAYLLRDQESEALLLTNFGKEFFARLFTMNAADRVKHDLGNRTISYSGVQAVDTPQLTIWRIQLYGGMAFSGDPAAPEEVATEIGAITGPKRLVAMLAARAKNET